MLFLHVALHAFVFSILEREHGGSTGPPLSPDETVAHEAEHALHKAHFEVANEIARIKDALTTTFGAACRSGAEHDTCAASSGPSKTERRLTCNAVLEGLRELRPAIAAITEVEAHREVSGMLHDALQRARALCWEPRCARNVVVPDGVVAIPEKAFMMCAALESIKIADTVELIGSGAFAGCSKLSAIRLPSRLKVIERGTFSGCIYTSIVIPDSVTIIGEGAFEACLDLESVSIPGSVVTIELQAFKDCRRLKEALIPNSVTTIGWGAFYGAASLTSLSLPAGLEAIPDWLCAFCKVLATVTLPNSIVSIGAGSFSVRITFCCCCCKRVRIPC